MPDQEQRYLLAVAYQAGPDVAITKGKDGGRDYFTDVELEKAAWRMLLADQRPGVGLFHVDGTVGHADIVESYIYRGPDWAMTAADGTEQVVKSGDWLVGLLCDDTAWDLYKAGRVQGVSIQGQAKRRRTVTV